MNRRMVTEHHPLPAGSARRGPRGGARLETGARTGWRPDIAVLVAVLGLLLGVLVMIPLINAVAPGPPSVFTVQPPTPPQPVLRARPTHSPSATTYRSGTSVVSHGVAYSALSAVRTSSLALPGNAASLQGNLVIVKLLLRGVGDQTEHGIRRAGRPDRRRGRLPAAAGSRDAPWPTPPGRRWSSTGWPPGDQAGEAGLRGAQRSPGPPQAPDRQHIRRVRPASRFRSARLREAG